MAHGADVIFGAAGQTGSGAILYATQHEVWGIGVDVDGGSDLGNYLNGIQIESTVSGVVTIGVPNGGNSGMANIISGNDAAGVYAFLRVDAARNRVVVGPASELVAPGMQVRELNWVSCGAPGGAIEVQVQVRYRTRPVAARVLEPSSLRRLIIFRAPRVADMAITN